MILRLFTVLILTFTTIAPSYAALDDDRFLIGLKLQKNKKSYFISFEKNEGEYSLTPDSEFHNLKHTAYFSEDLSYAGNALKVTRLEGIDYHLLADENLNNKINYSGYRNVEGFKNTSRSQDKKFAATVIGGGLLITGAVVGTIALIANAL